MIRLIENKFFFETQHINVTLLFNNHIIMAYSDDESELLKVFIIILTSFIIAVRIMIFLYHLVKQIRNISIRRRINSNGFRLFGRTVQMKLNRLTIWTN